MIRLLALVIALQISLVSVEQEIAIGREANAQVRSGMREVRDARVVAYVAAVGQRLVRHASGPGYPYSFGVVDERSINAFALPGGPVWVHRGVLQAAGNEAQFAGVMAHEIAHIARRHAASQLTKATLANWGLGLLGAVLGNGAGASAAQTAAGLLTNGVFLKFSRDHERDADRAGLEIMRRAGWNPRGMTELFEVLRREATRDPGRVETFFSSHPPPRDRITELQALIGTNAGGRRDSVEFQRMKARMR